MAKTIALLKNWNLYSNRTIKHIDTLTLPEFFLKHPEVVYSLRTGVNFNENDDLSAQLVINWAEDWAPDYLVVVNDDNSIFSTWFVIESTRTRNGQYQLQLRRDILNDFYDEAVDATTYIEKATVPPSNPLIFNSEGMSYNQIKTSETLLKDDTGSAWIVGYVAKNYPQENKTISAGVDQYDYTRANFPFAGLLPNDGESKKVSGSVRSYTLRYYFSHINEPLRIGKIISTQFFPSGEHFTKAGGLATIDQPALFVGTYGEENEINETLRGKSEELTATIRAQFQALSTEEETQLLNYNNYIIRNTQTGINYRLKITENTSEIYTGSPVAFDAIVLDTVGRVIEDSSRINPEAGLILETVINTYTITLEPTIGATYSVEITKANPTTRRTTRDAVYDVFAIPYSSVNIDLGGQVIQNSPDISLLIGQGIYKDLGGLGVYDLQLLPYSPIKKIGTGDGITLAGLIQGRDYNLITGQVNGQTKTVGVVLWATEVTGNISIPYVRNVENYKVDSETKLTRLCSPNYNGIFEFNIAKNGGVQYINVDYTYKPYTPYIHLNPNFGGLYGQNWGDSRGLILGGDFSLATLSDAWTNYEVNNKNYQAIFDRQIQSMDYKRGWERVSDITGAVTGLASGAQSGAITGFTSGGTAGAIGGAIAGGVSGGFGGILNLAGKESLYRENRDLQVDMYNYNLGNIKALPLSLAKSSALTNNNKIWPFIEEYDCTDTEKTMLKNKLKYNGMTVMAIGTIRDYLQIEPSYIQGQLIRVEGLANDSHISDAIYYEIKKGIYI